MSNADNSLTIGLAEIKALMSRAEQGQLAASDALIVVSLTRLVITLWQIIDEKKISIARLRKLIFGPKSEKRKKSPSKNKAENNCEQPSQPAIAGKVAPANTESERQGSEESSPAPALERKKRKGHGRLAADDYTGAEIVHCLNKDIRPGENCPNNPCIGSLYDTKEPEPFIRLAGCAIVEATNYVREVLRCTKCGQRFTAGLPDGIKHEKYDVTADVSIVMHHYGASMPFYRIAVLQDFAGIPLPPSTQWERCEGVADKAFPIYRELERQAAQSQIIHNDDTSVRILSLIKENKELPESERKGMHTTGIGARAANFDIALFFSGRKYSAENLAAILGKRPKDLAKPLVVADAERKNWIDSFKKLVIKCLCLAHGRRKFVDCEAAFPDESKHMLDELAKVYEIDAQTRGMTADERLAFHQQHSQKIMDDMQEWIDNQLSNNIVEHNSSLGKALKYMRNNWSGLTKFLQYGNAPLDNNHVERLLRRAVILRKNALFYRTEHGAFCGDILMSIISTCALNNVNAFEYFIALVNNGRDVRANPAAWLPWTYKLQEKIA